MFTGIVQELGSVKRIQGESIFIEAGFKEMEIGESISVNGVCLTVSRVHPSRILQFDVSGETKDKSNLGQLRVQDSVNLERSLRLSDRLGGHIVTGHVEGTGRIKLKKREKDSTVMEIGIPAELKKYVVPKGSIAVDGVSLTVVDVCRDSFTVSLIPHTLASTTLGIRKAGEVVNLETDILARYAEKTKKGESISWETLKNAGFAGKDA